MLNLDKCAQTHIQLFAESGNWSALYRTCQSDHLHWNMSKYAVIYAHKAKSNRLRFSELQRVYFYLCALTISTKIISSKRSASHTDLLNIVSIESFELAQYLNNYFHYKIPKDAFLSKGASSDEMASQNHHQMHDDPKCCFSRSIGNF